MGNKHAQYIGTLIAQQHRLLRRKELLTNFKEPVLVLQRTNGTVELYHNVKEEKFIVPKLKTGQEKHIILGRQYQIDFPYAGKTFKMYWCHEDWAFPHVWGAPQRYIGDIRDAPVITEGKAAPRTGWILEQANVNSEALRDRERKVLIAWERFTAQAHEKNIMAWAKFILYAAGAAALLWWVYNMFWQPAGAPAAATAAANATQVIVVQ